MFKTVFSILKSRSELSSVGVSPNKTRGRSDEVAGLALQYDDDLCLIVTMLINMFSVGSRCGTPVFIKSLTTCF